MKITEILTFLKTVIENNIVAAVKSLKAHTFTMKLDSNKVEITNKLPKVFKAEVVNPDPDYTKQLTQIKNAVDINIALLAMKLEKDLRSLEKSLKPVEAVTVTNLSTIKPPTVVKVSNLQTKIAVTNLYEVAKEIGKLRKSVEAQKLDPKINVPDVIVPEIKIPTINVPKTTVNIDLTKLEEYLKVLSNDPKNPLAVRLSDGEKFYEAIFEAVSGGSSHSYSYQDQAGDRTYGRVNSDQEVMTANNDRWGINNIDRDGDTIILGKEDLDGNWLIVNIEKTGENRAFTYATNKNNDIINLYSDAWSNKDTLNYGNYSVAF